MQREIEQAQFNQRSDVIPEYPAVGKVEENVLVRFEFLRDFLVIHDFREERLEIAFGVGLAHQGSGELHPILVG